VERSSGPPPTYEKDGEPKQIRELVVTGASLETMKVREEAA